MSFLNAVLYLLESGQTWILKTGSRTGRQEFEWSSPLHTLITLYMTCTIFYTLPVGSEYAHFYDRITLSALKSEIIVRSFLS